MEIHDIKVISVCEFSGIVRDAFALRGFDSWSCDLLPSERSGNHFQCDVRELDLSIYDLMIAFPPCTYLCSSGARWFKHRQKEQEEALDFIRYLLNAPGR